MKKIFFLAIFWIVIITSHVKGDGMIEVFRWKQMDFYDRGDSVKTVPKPISGKITFPDQGNSRFKRNEQKVTSRDAFVNSTDERFNDPANVESSSYIPYNNVPMGATHYNGRLFITMPRRRPGIPSTLNYIDMQKDGNNKSPKLNAYPNFETNYLNPNNVVANTSRLISVYRTTVDECNRLWFIDTGMLEYPNNRQQIQRPTIWIIDLNTNHVIRRFPIPESIVETGQGLASITIDVDPNRCNMAFAYIPDLVNRRLYVYNFANDRMWSFSHNYFNFDPISGDLNIGGQTFRWDDGIFSITLSPLQSNGYRQVFFHAMASNHEFTVSSEVLQNESNAARSDHGQDFQLLGYRGEKHQSTMHTYDPNTGVIFYDEIHRNGVGCWNTKTPFSAANHGSVFQDENRMIYPSDITIDKSKTIWVMSNSMPIFIYSNLDPNVYNFRVWKQNVDKAIENTICA